MVNSTIVSSLEPITLVGAGDVTPIDVSDAQRVGPRLIAADGGANALCTMGLLPEATLGDLDSLTAATRAKLASDTVHLITEQESTDFAKCLRMISAPLILGLGFTGTRIDHMLACFSALASSPSKPCILFAPEQLITLCPPRLNIDLPEGMPVSLYPLAPVTGKSTGLDWPIDQLTLSPLGRIGTSNRASGGQVTLEVSAPHLLLILPRAALHELSQALQDAPAQWPAPGE